MVDVSNIFFVITYRLFFYCELDRLVHMDKCISQGVLKDLKGCFSLLILTIDKMLSSYFLQYDDQRFIIFHKNWLFLHLQLLYTVVFNFVYICDQSPIYRYFPDQYPWFRVIRLMETYSSHLYWQILILTEQRSDYNYLLELKTSWLIWIFLQRRMRW